MNQLARNNYNHLIFNNEDITQKTGFYLMTTEKDTEFNIGLNRNIKTTEGAFGKKIFLGTNKDNFDFEITLVKAREVKGNLMADKIHNEDIENLCRYIIRKEPKSIEKDNKLYYGIFTTSNGEFYNNNEGYIKFKFIMTEPYIYSKIIEKKFDTSISNEIELKNDTDLIDEETFIDIEFNSSNNTKIKFINLDNDSYIELNNLTKNNNYKVCGEEMQILNEDNYKEIVYSPKFIYLNYKPNTIKIESIRSIKGKIKYQIKYGIK